MAPTDQATAFAPASIGNVAVGFDMLGLAISGPGDRVTARRVSEDEIRIAGISASEAAKGAAADLTRDPEKNTAGIAVTALWRDHGPGYGCELQIQKGVPAGSGLGSSAASAVAGVVAANALLPEPLALEALLPYALAGERFASKALHADNVAPCLFGGLTLCPVRLLPDVIRLPVPTGIRSIVVHPDMVMNTSDARRALAPECLLRTAIEQQACLAGFLAGCYTDNRSLIARSLRDIIVEPQRGPLVEGFDAVKAAALDAGALGCSLSGSGPAVFAWSVTARADTVRKRMLGAFASFGRNANAWISPLDSPGVSIV